MNPKFGQIIPDHPEDKIEAPQEPLIGLGLSHGSEGKE